MAGGLSGSAGRKNILLPERCSRLDANQLHFGQKNPYKTIIDRPRTTSNTFDRSFTPKPILLFIFIYYKFVYYRQKQTVCQSPGRQDQNPLILRLISLINFHEAIKMAIPSIHKCRGHYSADDTFLKTYPLRAAKPFRSNAA